MKWKYRGDQLLCPLCGKTFSRFLPGGFDFPVLKTLDVIGAGYRENAKCIQCDSSDRERLVYLYLEKQGYVGPTARYAVLHIAPEKSLQRLLKGLSGVLHISVDIASPLADEKMDILHLRFPDNEFDVVICNHVLEHISEDIHAMREIFRVLKPGGRAILQVPIANNASQTIEDDKVVTEKEREERFGQKDHVRIYVERDYIERLEQAGFLVERVLSTSFLNPKQIATHALNPCEVLYIGRK